MLTIYYNSGHFGVDIHVLPVFVIGLAFAALAYFSGKLNIFNHWSPEVELNVPLAGIGSIKIKADHTVTQIAYTAWAELMTRKAGLQIDLENDIFSEIYGSWYQLFANTRELIKTIPAYKLRDKNTKLLVALLVDVLNKGLRPHLTKWQGKFRKWYENELSKEVNKDKTPQEIQKNYPHYEELTKDLVVINQQMITYANELKKLVRLN